MPNEQEYEARERCKEKPFDEPIHDFLPSNTARILGINKENYMNREIKFRVYDKIDKCIAPVEELHKDWLAIPVMDEYGGHLEKRKLEDVNLMQFTGLIDKNGKEIYEGDIVSVNEKDFNDKTNYLVKWFGDDNYPAFDIDGWEGDSNGLCEISQTGEWEMEVIGNIYQNKVKLNI
jgi:uncharacterized phage protein (TIGR01671 family)